MNFRMLAGTAVLALGAWALVSIFHEPARPHAPVAWESSAQCAECHGQIDAEWRGSWHAQAWNDEEVRKTSDNFSNLDCIDCHAPQPVFETGIGNRPLARSTRRAEGVDCISCHQMKDGRMAGTLDNETVACRPTAQRELTRPEACGGCHNQHGTVDQWRESRFAQPGPEFKDCIACHMPYRDPADPSKGRDHTMHGGHDIALVRSAVTLVATRDQGVPVVEIENVGAGHNYPTDERSRASDVFWRTLAVDGSKGEWRRLHRFRNPYRFEVGEVNTELPAGKKISLRIDAEEARGTIEVALFYKLSPHYADPARPDPEREASLVHSLRLEP